MNTKEFDSAGDGNIVQEYGDIGVQFLNIGFKNEGLFAYCKDILDNYHAIKLEHKYLKYSNNQHDVCLFGRLDDYFGILDLVIFHTSNINDVLSNKIVEIWDKNVTNDISSFDNTRNNQFQIISKIHLNDFNKYSITRIDKKYTALMYLPLNNFLNYEFLTESKEHYYENCYTEDYDVEDIQPYGLKVDDIIENNYLSFNDYLIFQEKQKKKFEEYNRNLDIETDDNPRVIKDEDIWDSLNDEERIQYDADRWTDEILDESDKREAEKLVEENNRRDKRNRYESDFDNSILSNKSLFLVGRDSRRYDFTDNVYSILIFWVPSLISYNFKDEMYEIQLVSYQPEVLVENEPEKYEYEYGRYKNVFAFVISKSEIERLKQLNINEDNLESFLTKIKQDHDLDILTITSETDSSFIFTSYIKPSLYKENIKKDNLPF